MSPTDTSPSSNGRGSDTWWLSWTHLSVDRRTPSYCRVTFDHPPINTITARTVAELAEVVGLIEHDPDLNVVVFDSANPDCYLGDYDTEHDPGWTAALGVGPTAMHAWLDLLVRLSRAPVVSIASIRGRVRGAGSEFVLACDLRFASRGRAPLGQFDGPSAEQCGHVNRVIADDRLDDEVESIASTLARFDHDEIARTKSCVDQVTLPADSGFPPALADLFGEPR
jgi:enoyl-CoA hydratase/carnithine racemase